MPVKEVTFENSRQHELFGTLKYPSDLEDPVPLIIVLHKFGSHSNHELIANLANFLYPQGFATLRFDFHGHGRSGGDMQEVHITQKIDDVISAISFCQQFEFIDTDHTTLIGHGMGADVGLLTATRDDRVKCLIMLAPASDLNVHLRHFSPDQIREVKEKGYTTHQQFGKIGKEFFRHLKRFNPREEIKKISIPILFIHGKNDFQVRWESSKELYLDANEPKRLEIIEDCDHYFQQPEHREQLMSIILLWINQYMKGIKRYEAETTDRLEHASLY